MKCPHCNAGDEKINDLDCSGCGSSGECGFCHGDPQSDCPYDCDEGVCTECDGSGFADGQVQCSDCGEQGDVHEFDLVLET